jgi:integrase
MRCAFPHSMKSELITALDGLPFVFAIDAVTPKTFLSGQISTTKGGRLRYVPMTARLKQALQAHRHLRGPLVLYRPNGDSLTDSAVREAVGRAARRAGLPNNGPHILRHTLCSHLAMRGAPARAIQELAGHRDLATTQRYMHLSPTAVRSAIRLLEQPAPASDGDAVETAPTANENVSR